MLPPSERETYQTHIPWRSKAVLLTLPPLSTWPAPPVSAPALDASAQAIRTASAAASAMAPRLLRGPGLTTGLNTVVAGLLRAPSATRPRLNIHSLPQVPTRHPTISPTGKILCAAALAASALCGAPAGAHAAGPRLQHAGLAQKGRELVFSVRTSKPVGLAQLEPRPDPQRPAARFLCLSLSHSGPLRLRLLCLGGRKAHRQVGLVVFSAAGKPLEKKGVPATVKRPQPDKLIVALDPERADLPLGAYEWRVLQSNGCEELPCARGLPAAGTSAFRLRPV